MKFRHYVGVLACSLATFSVASAQTSSAVVTPNSNLYIENIPPISQRVADDVAKYTEFRAHRFVGWHPKKLEMIVAHRAQGASTSQLFWLREPMGKLEPLTNHPDPVGGGSAEPTEGKYVLYTASAGGSEAFQIFRLDAPGQAGVQITPSNGRHSFQGWRRVNGKFTGEIMYSSNLLDRSMTPEQRANMVTTFSVMDPLKADSAKVIAELPGVGWFGGAMDRAAERMLLTRYISANESEVWVYDLKTKQRTKLLPLEGGKKAAHFAGRFSRDGKQIFVSSDRDGEFREAFRMDLTTKELKSFTRDMPHDVEATSEDDTDEEDTRVIYVRFNVKGKSELRAYDAQTLAPVALKGLPLGTIASASTRRAGNELALNVTGARSPGEIVVYNPKTEANVTWTRAYSAVDTSNFQEQQVITWKSFDGLEISGLINRAPARFAGKRPVLIDIHGGPEAQARIGFAGRQNYYVNELGVTVIQPNVRGSSGFGKTFLALDNGFKREDSVKDIGALLDWIATQPDLDASRVLVAGGSYGGYMSLAVSTNYPERIAGAVDVVGISHFVTFLETTESYRRDLRRSEYGDERDPKMREHLNAISPLTNAHKIKKPLLVVQGKNDPRVPYTEAEQIVAKARGNGSAVWYLRAENEGHGFARKENADFYFYTFVRFMQETILR